MFPQRIWLGRLRQLASSYKARLAHNASETPPQYDVSEKMQKLFDIKQKQREAARAYLRKIVMNPYRPKTDPVPFDPVLFRFNALMTYHEEYIKINEKNTFVFLVIYIMPIFLAYWWFTSIREEREKQYRAGEIPYENRIRNFL